MTMTLSLSLSLVDVSSGDEEDMEEDGEKCFR